MWGADLEHMEFISKCNKVFQFFLCVIDIYSKYAWVVLLKDKTGITITNAFHKVLNESGCKLNITWVDKSRAFYKRSLKSWLQDNDIEMYSTNNESK